MPERIKLAEQAEHTFEAYTSLGAILRNQKRQIIGQTFVHVLVDQYLKPGNGIVHGKSLMELLVEKDRTERFWLKKLVAEHLRRTRFFWRLYPELLTHRFKRLSKFRLMQKLQCLPAAIAGMFLTTICSYLAHRALKSGATDYWPKVERRKRQDGRSIPPAVVPGLNLGNLK
jgi:hypothetical protein